jgi:hypothetical protein
MTARWGCDATAYSGANSGFTVGVVVVRYFDADHRLLQRGKLIGDGGSNLGSVSHTGWSRDRAGEDTHSEAGDSVEELLALSVCYS